MVGRPQLDVGTYGNIRTYHIKEKLWEARTSYRDEDGVTRPVRRRDETENKAIRTLKAAIKDRQRGHVAELTRESRFAEAAEMWLSTVDRRRRGSTYDRYRTRLRNKIVPVFGSLRLHECTTQRMDSYLETLEKRDHLKPNTIRGYRSVLSGVMAYAVRKGALSTNPVRESEPIEGRGKRSRSLLRDEREDLLAKVDADDRAVADDLPDIFRYLIGTGVRIGEVMGLRWFRVDLTEGISVHGDNLVRETVLCAVCNGGKTEHHRPSRRVGYAAEWGACPRGVGGVWTPGEGRGLVLHEPKSVDGFRILPLPDFVLLMLQMRYPGQEASMAPVFPIFPTYPVTDPTERRSSRSRRRTGDERLQVYRPGARDGGRFMVDSWRDPNNTSRSVRKFRDGAGYPWVTAHVFRHTAATIMDEQKLTPREISSYLGHARPSFTQDHYMDRRVLDRGGSDALDQAMRPV